jgi:cytochrome c
MKGRNMTRKHLKAVLMTPLLILIYGCQPDAPVPASAAPASAAVPAPAASQAAVVAQSKIETVGVTGSKERELAQKSGCFACHTVEKKLVGPGWNDVAAKYHGQKDAEAMLVAKVTKGGSGVWGAVPMPPNSPKVGDAEIKTLVRFILSLK